MIGAENIFRETLTAKPTQAEIKGHSSSSVKIMGKTTLEVSLGSLSLGYHTLQVSYQVKGGQVYQSSSQLVMTSHISVQIAHLHINESPSRPTSFSQ